MFIGARAPFRGDIMTNLLLRTFIGAATLFGGVAIAADMPLKAPVVRSPVEIAAYNWSGFYIGAHGGGGWAKKCFTYANLGIEDGCHTADGWLAGGQVGYNWQASSFVFGVEGSGSWARLRGEHVTPDFPFIFRTHVDSIFMATGRIGIPWERMLFYMKGGAAWAREKYDYIPAPNLAKASETRFGWVIGGGAEFALSANWSLAAEYNYLHFGKRDTTFTYIIAPIPGNTFVETIDQHVHLATVRLNYRFGGAAPVVARY
jgi:outer membrane immunogenic protein